MRWPIAAYAIQSTEIVPVFVFRRAIVDEDGKRIVDSYGGEPLIVDGIDGPAISVAAVRIGIYPTQAQAAAVLLPRLREQLAGAGDQYEQWLADRRAALMVAIGTLERLLGI